MYRVGVYQYKGFACCMCMARIILSIYFIHASRMAEGPCIGALAAAVLFFLLLLVLPVRLQACCTGACDAWSLCEAEARILGRQGRRPMAWTQGGTHLTWTPHSRFLLGRRGIAIAETQ